MTKNTRFDWTDPFLLEDQLTDDEKLIRDSARAYAQGELQPRVIDAYANEETDLAIFREMGELGLLGATVPDEVDHRHLTPRRGRRSSPGASVRAHPAR